VRGRAEQTGGTLEVNVLHRQVLPCAVLDVRDADDIVAGNHEEDTVSAAPFAMKRLSDLSPCLFALRRGQSMIWEVFQ